MKHTTMDSKAIIDELETNIRQELDLCDALDTPYVCANIQTPEAYERIEQLIIKKIITARMSIAQAIIAIEIDINPQSYTE